MTRLFYVAAFQISLNEPSCANLHTHTQAEADLERKEGNIRTPTNLTSRLKMIYTLRCLISTSTSNTRRQNQKQKIILATYRTLTHNHIHVFIIYVYIRDYWIHKRIMHTVDSTMEQRIGTIIVDYECSIDESQIVVGRSFLSLSLSSQMIWTMSYKLFEQC